MLTITLSIISILLVIVVIFVMYFQYVSLKTYTKNQMGELVDQINDSQYYGYKFDKKQEQNIQNVDTNLQKIYDSFIKLQNNVKYLEGNSVTKKDIETNLKTDVATIGTISSKKLTVANTTDKNNIVIEGGRTTDGNNEGLSSINFNGYYDNGNKRIDNLKSLWRITADQRGASDTMSMDQVDKENKLWNYTWMSDGTVGFNNNKLRFSNQWTGHPDNATDKAEISNDASGYKQLMIVGNKSSGEGIRKVGVWDRLDVHGNMRITTNNQQNTKYGLDINNGSRSVLSVKNDGELQLPRKDGKLTQFDKDGKNYIRGQSYTDELNVNNNLCINDVCINKADLVKIIAASKK